MPHQIHINELILHDFDLPESQGVAFQRALSAELERLLGSGELPRESSAVPHMAITLPCRANQITSSMSLGAQAATSVASLLHEGEGTR